MTNPLTAKHKPKFSLLTFYKFVNIPENEVMDIALEHLDFCRDLGLKWRVYIGTEGISSTVTGNTWQLWSYRHYLENSHYFRDIKDIDAKATPVDDHQFPRMSVKVRDEIVTLGSKVTAEEVLKFHKEISPEGFKALLDSGKTDDYVILDMRNDYEYDLGHFKNAVPAWTLNFREVPKLLEKYKNEFGKKKVIFYCTGGIRCEKLSVLMTQEWFDELYSLQWGVVKYVNKYNDGNWLGNLYTFDDRISTQVGDETTHTTIGKCIYTEEATDLIHNCRYAPCNAHFLATQKAFRSHGGFCSEECYHKAQEDGLVRVVDWDQYDYKNRMREVHRGERDLEATRQEIKIHIKKEFGKSQFSRKNSIKEVSIQD